VVLKSAPGERTHQAPEIECAIYVNSVTERFLLPL
jgi:hypothetical protein